MSLWDFFMNERVSLVWVKYLCILLYKENLHEQFGAKIEGLGGPG